MNCALTALFTSFSSYGNTGNVKPSWLTGIECSLTCVRGICSANEEELSECDHGNPIGYTNCLSGDAELKCGK